MESYIRSLSEQFPAILVTGPRQVGKTTMLRHISAADRKYVSLDEPAARDLALREPALFLAKYAPPVLIDEIQYAPRLLPLIKLAVDADGSKGGYWLTGSQVFWMMKGVSESLAGRMAVVQLLGLSERERAGKESVPFNPEAFSAAGGGTSAGAMSLRALYERIFRGSMPALYAGVTDRDAFYNGYVATYIERDIRALTQVADEMKFYRFLVACAGRTGGILNYADLASDADVSQPTAKSWLSLLVSTGIVYLLYPYYGNALKRAIKTPKLYFTDTGLCAFLTRWDSPESLENGAMNGAVFETYAISEILKSYYFAGLRPPMYYFRDTERREIDLILEKNMTLYPVEIKKSANPGRRAVKHFDLLEKTGPAVGTGAVICFSDTVMPIDAKNVAIPIGML
ncbi:MAG: ATP-binding protein [Clostridiales Family XIII bacterium]|jgi:predicted AAA+ superfamily ATPase|nr:ATP-binding protein [Clostridiales Family XIII bacterium]